MNERARWALVRTALDGKPQGRFALHSATGDCALGVIHRDAHESCGEDPMTCTYHDPYACAISWGELSYQEMHQITAANDIDGWDFLTIARKIGLKENEHDG